MQQALPLQHFMRPAAGPSAAQEQLPNGHAVEEQDSADRGGRRDGEGHGEHTGQPSAAAGYEAGTLAEHDPEYDAALDASLAQLSPELLSSLLASPPATGDEPREPVERQQQQHARHLMHGSAQARTQQHEQQLPVAHQLYQPQQYHQQPAEPHRPQQRLQQQRRLLQQQQQRTAGPALGTTVGPHSHLELHLPVPRHPGIVARPVTAEELPSLVVLVPPHPPSGHSQGALPARATELISEEKPAKRVKRVVKREGAPKRPRSAYLYFLSEFRPQFQRDNPEVKKVSAIARMAGEAWRAMSPENKSRFEQQSATEKAEYHAAVKAFEVLHPKPPRIRRKRVPETMASDDESTDLAAADEVTQALALGAF